MRSLQLALLGAAIAGMATTVALGQSGEGDSGRPTSSEASPAESEAALLADRYGCWSGDAPADMTGKMPGHVVVVSDGEAVYGGSRMVALALEQVCDGQNHELLVVAFCR